jgi:hypothetical protein
MSDNAINFKALAKKLQAEKAVIVKRLGLNKAGPIKKEATRKNKAAMKANHAKAILQQLNNAQRRLEAHAEKARVSGKTRKRHHADMKLLADAGMLPHRHHKGKPVAKLEGYLPHRSL